MRLIAVLPIREIWRVLVAHEEIERPGHEVIVGSRRRQDRFAVRLGCEEVMKSGARCNMDAHSVFAFELGQVAVKHQAIASSAFGKDQYALACHWHVRIKIPVECRPQPRFVRLAACETIQPDIRWLAAPQRTMNLVGFVKTPKRVARS